MAPQTPLLLIDNLFDTVMQYPLGTLSTNFAARVGYEGDRVADYRRERTSWQSATSSAGHDVRTDLGVGVSRNCDALFIDRGHNLFAVAVSVQYSDDGVTYTNHVTRTMPAAGTLGGDPTTALCVTEEGAAYMLFAQAAAAHRYWRVSLNAGGAFFPVVPGLILGLKTQLLGYSATFDEDQSERTQPSDTSRAGYRGTDSTYSWRTLALDLRYIGASEYDATIRAARELLFERNVPAVIAMDYGANPERAWMYQYEGTTWAMPKTRVYRAGRMMFREVGASLS